MGFWFVITALTLGVGAVLALALLRGRSTADSPAAYDLQVYRDQLKEVDRDLARGVIAKADADRVRTEVSRRVLAADAALKAQENGNQSQGRGNVAVAFSLMALMLAGSLALYAKLGAPGYRDLPLEARIAASDAARNERFSQAEAESMAPPRLPLPTPSAEYLDLMEKLRETVAERPEDLRGLRLLVRNEASLGNVSAAYAAQTRVIDVKGPEATADDYALLAELLIAAAGGYVSTEAESALRQALQRDPDHPTSRFYLGIFLLQVDRPDAAFRTWERLLRESQPDAPWVAPIRNQIVDVAARAGVKYEPTATPSGPSREEIEAAAGMSAENRDQMIRGMVQGLSDRLASEGGSPQEWAQLIGALGVLGDTDQARAIWLEAQIVFDGKAAALSEIRASAERAGVAQ